MDIGKIRYITSNVASVVNTRPKFHTFVYNAMGERQRVTRIYLRQLRVILVASRMTNFSTSGLRLHLVSR